MNIYIYFLKPRAGVAGADRKSPAVADRGLMGVFYRYTTLRMMRQKMAENRGRGVRRAAAAPPQNPNVNADRANGLISPG